MPERQFKITNAAGGTAFSVRVVPRASKNEVSGRYGQAIKIRLTAPPVEGAANRALIDFLSEILDVRKSQLEILAGHGARDKIVCVVGLRPQEVETRLLGLLDDRAEDVIDRSARRSELADGEMTMTWDAPNQQGSDLSAEAEQVIRLVREDLAGRLNIAAQGIKLASVEGVEWRNTSLGCPQPGMMYAQVIVPGYRVVVEAEGQRYEYHTDRGRSVVLCEE
jgi:uncharacterized protein (TIGR00251 family)